MTDNVFALVDCNNFYVSCERVFRPDLKNVPVAVLSNNDGCIIARSKEVKDLGVKMGTPLFKVRDLIKEHKIRIFSSNYSLYDNISTRVMQTLETFSPRVEIYSIDEAFLDVSGRPHRETYGHRIRQTVIKDVGVPVCVGMATTKTLAKLANYAAKKFTQTGGVVDLTDPQRRQRLLDITPVSEVWGVGRHHTESLARIGITTAGQLARMDSRFLRKKYSVVMARTLMELNGESCLDLEEITPVKKQIVCSRSFGEKITDKSQVRQALCEFAARAAEKLRKEQQRATVMTAFIRTSPFDKNAPHYGNAATGRFFQSTSDTRQLVGMATNLFERIWKEGHRYAKAGVMLGDFTPEQQMQYPLFGQPEDTDTADRLMLAIDNINKGVGKIWFGGQRPKKDWYMKQDLKSPAYTTRWDCLPVVRG
ncbi:translesion error-prone DNA polymerase V subunit UmuC [Pelovirga terrestris]|uniref:Translesion error-prone DNA polymerase V subunit UmuC n=1 Tax=Pelovirga terrestris TaxID=2771352 RepID=A0A8J6QQA1_9BACT|nr:translesion error-prone DNA polymerase V subunit UmuC [Pelovirga terrestris]MBD1400388.1 translesion error-prone DNA polymerase V subunit UmuC [Pelovirga terrestris]